jgi:hypothetical protein
LDRPCGLVVRVLDYISRGLGSIPGTTRIKKKVVGLERGPLSLVSTTEELFERKSSGSGLENREYGRRDPSRWPRGTLYPQKLALTSPTSGGLPVVIVRSRAQTTEFFLIWVGQSGFDSQQGWWFFVDHISRPAAGSIQLSVLQSIPLFLFFN